MRDDLPTDAGGESPLLLLGSLISNTTDVFFTNSRSVFGDDKGWLKEGKTPERFLDIYIM